MAQYSVFQLASGDGLVMDVQSDLLEPLNTRIVVPLLQKSEAPEPARRLNPIFEIDGQSLVFVAQFLAAIRESDLGQEIANLREERDSVTAALDMAFHGF